MLSALSNGLLWRYELTGGTADLTEPVLDHLGYSAPPAEGADWQRVWWCPTGPLTLLPLHAAGEHRTPGAAVLDRVTSSYTPTLRALLEAGDRPGRAAGPNRMLFTGMPVTPGQRDLPDVLREEELPRGGVLLHDGRLTVAEFGAQRYPAEFAYLSGCKTAVGGTALPDEAISLAAALQYTGYRHVIATLWSVGDDSAARVAEGVYGALVHDGVLDARPAARALHEAVRRLRETYPDRSGVWTPFAHFGP